MMSREAWQEMLSRAPLDLLSAEWGRRMAASRATAAGGRPKKERPCPKCGLAFGARAWRAHVPKCGVEMRTEA
jgi:hypothetical protein